MPEDKTILDLLKKYEDCNAIALSAPDRSNLTFEKLLDLIELNVFKINEAYIDSHGRSICWSNVRKQVKHLVNVSAHRTNNRTACATFTSN